MKSEYFKNPVGPLLKGFLLGILSFIILGGLFILFVTGGNIQISTLELMNNKSLLVSIQLIQMITLFVLPPVFYAIFSKNDIPVLYNLHKPVEWKKYAIGAILAIVLFPVVIFLHDIMVNLPWPANLAVLAEQQKEASEKILKLFLDSTDFGNYILMLGIVSLGAGFTEELFFRGLLMPILSEPIRLNWISKLFTGAIGGSIINRFSSKKSATRGIIVSGLLFAILHQSVYDMVPYILVGILLGYIYYITEDLKLNIFIHALFNGFQVSLNYLYQVKAINIDIESMESFPLWVVIPCFFILYSCLYLLVRDYKFSK